MKDTNEEPRDADRFAVVEAMTKAAVALGWRPSLAESNQWRVNIVALPPLADSNPNRNRWPDEPEEQYEAKIRDYQGRFNPDLRLGGES